jgi:uncharacterized Zn-finger protein
MQRTFWIVLSAAVLSAVVVVATGCQKKPAAPGGSATAAACPYCTDKKASHEAHHGGCLNAIETCAVGHAEIKVDGKTLSCWLVGGENETGRAVRVSDPAIDLKVTADGGKAWSISLQAKPLELAGEKAGDCSHFEGTADWLDGLKKFHAEGQVDFKGQKRAVKIDYPEGYDPD